MSKYVVLSMDHDGKASLSVHTKIELKAKLDDDWWGVGSDGFYSLEEIEELIADRVSLSLVALPVPGLVIFKADAIVVPEPVETVTEYEIG